MNKLQGNIVAVKSSASMSIVDVKAGADIFSAVVLETPASAAYLRAGKTVTILFKETEVSIGKNLSGMISLRNRFPGVIKGIKTNEILAEITLAYQGLHIVSVISRRSAEKMELKEGDHVEWLVKTNEVSLLHS